MVRRIQRWSIAGLLAGLVLGAGAASATRFPDPVGDVRGGPGPDLLAVSVLHTRSTVTFRFRFADARPLGAGESWVDMLLVGIDVPPRSLVRTPRGWLGGEYYLGTHGTEPSAVLVQAAAGARGTVLARPKVVRSAHTIAMSIARRALGDPDWFEFAVAVGREGSTAVSGGGSDEAPARGVFRYRLVSARP